MSHKSTRHAPRPHALSTERAPGDEERVSGSFAGYTAGLAVLAMGVHPVVFLHISTGPDNTNTVLALAFGILIVTLVVSGSLWMMAHLNANMLPASAIMQMQR